MSDSPELLKPDAEVKDNQLQIEIGNLNAENETLRADYAALIESSTHITNKLWEEVQQARSQIETLQASPPAPSPPQFELPEAADLLNQLKSKRKKSTATLADIEAILEMIEK